MAADDDYRFKNKSAEVLREFRTIIAKVEKRCARSRFPILPAFHSVRNVGTIKSWHHMEVLFLCAVEYRAKKVESQIRAPERIGALSEHISAIRGDTEWRLPTGKIVWTHHVKGPDGKSHPQRTEEDIAGDTPQSSPGPGGSVPQHRRRRARVQLQPRFPANGWNAGQLQIREPRNRVAESKASAGTFAPAG